MSAATLDDYRWLVSQEGNAWYDSLIGDTRSLVQQAQQLRKQLSASRTHLLLELHELRQRGTVKFEAASRLFFTRRGLEQATDQWIAAYKAQRFPVNEPIADLCCGIGGDLFGLAAHTATTGVDRDPIHALLAETNCRILDPPTHRVETTDATTLDLGHFAAWHIDPDRRPAGRRTTHLDWSAPATPAIDQLLAQVPHAAIKSAPAADLPSSWMAVAERQWIGSGRECKQQVAWFGDLALHPEQHTVVVVRHRRHCSDLLVGSPDATVDVTASMERFVCEPHAAVLAAKLTGALAQKHDLQTLDREVDYLVSDRPIDDPLVSCFEVLEATVRSEATSIGRTTP